MKYFMGIDGGGTKSRLLAVDENSKTVGEAFGGSTNLYSNTREIVSENIRQIVSDFFTKSNAKMEDCLGLCIGSAGLDSENQILIMEQILKEIGFRCCVIAVNDCLLPLAAVTRGGPGVAVISGTGSIGYGMDSSGRTVRCGGWGHILDDTGSGYWIGKEALKRALRSFDGRGEKTILEEQFKEIFQVDHLPECIEMVDDSFDKATMAGYGRLVKEGAAQEDKVCIEIINEAAKELFLLADTVIKRLNEHTADVIVSGGTILNNDLLRSVFQRYMNQNHPQVQVHKIDQEPVMGAIYLVVSMLKADRQCQYGKGVSV